MQERLNDRVVRDALTGDATITFTPEDVADRKEGLIDRVSLDRLLRELENMTGLDTVKREVRELVNAEIANQRLSANGYEVNAFETRHMLFMGNPGTGKTSVARLVGRIFKALGLLNKGDFLEVDRTKLVAGYVGQTADKTAQVIESALDGVLFIDEAYTLARGDSQSDFGREAIDTLITWMENYRDRLIVIFAGYSGEMQQFLKENPGLESRVPYKIDFPDYTGEQMHQIFLEMCQKSGWICPPEVSLQVKQTFNMAHQHRGRVFANGRYVRNFFEEMVRKLKNRIVQNDLNGSAMRTFSLKDLMD